jgi:gluconokinase
MGVMIRQDQEPLVNDRHAIVVMGVSGSGKSTLGGMLAETLGCPFLEGDEYHLPASVAKMSAGLPLTDEDRWPWLDELGAALHRAAFDQGCAVASCSALKRSYRARLEVATEMPITFVLLDLDRQELVRRLNDRPGHFMPASLIDTQLGTLEQPQDGESAIVLDACEPPERLCERVRAALETDSRDVRARR